MGGLPVGWENTLLGEICSKPQYGFTTKSSLNGKVKYLRTTDITSGKTDWSKVPFCVIEPEDINKYQLNDGDILISRAGSVGFHSLIINPPENTVFASYLIRFKSLKGVSEKYLSHFFNSKSYWNQITQKSAGVAVQNVNATKLSELKIPIAPLNEQIRIANKLDTLLAKVEAAQTRLDKIPTLLKRFRQSVLAAATSGELTEEWRTENNIEKVNINKIKEGWAKLAEKDGKKYKVAKISSPKNKLWNLPYTWISTQVGYVFDVYVGSTPSRKEEKYWGGEIHWVSSSEVAFCLINGTKETITQEGLKNTSTKIHPPGTVLLAMIGQGKTRGQPAILNIYACHNQNTAALRVLDGYCITKYLYYFLWEQYEETRKVGAGNNQQALNKTTVQALPFPLPPKEEQKQIVRRVESLFTLADSVEKQYQQARLRTDKLTQSLLAKAFRGELVPQDPNDEPAEKLLARIQAEREKLKPKKARKNAR